MNKFQKMMEDFLKDRNGADELALFLSVVGLIAIVGAGAFSYPYVTPILTLLGVAALAGSIFRILSKHKNKRYRENYKFRHLFTGDPAAKQAKEAEKAKKKALKEVGVEALGEKIKGYDLTKQDIVGDKQTIKNTIKS